MTREARYMRTLRENELIEKMAIEMLLLSNRLEKEFNYQVMIRMIEIQLKLSAIKEYGGV